MGTFDVGPWEIILILGVLLLLFGAKRLPEIGKGLGKGLREFKGATKGLADDVTEGLDVKSTTPSQTSKKDPADS